MTHPSRAGRMAGLVLALAFAWALDPLHADGDSAEVSGILLDTEPLDHSTDVRVSRIETFTEEELIKIGTLFEIGDMLTSLTGKVAVELACGDSTILRFAGHFQVIINPPEEADCAVNFLNGDLDVLTDEPTEVEVGTVILGSEGTQYSVEVSRADRAVDRTLMVFDGTIRVRGPDLTDEVGTGSTWRLSKGRPSRGKVESAQLARVSTRYARFDAAKVDPASGESRAQAVSRFKQLHYQVLEKPDDSSRRGALAQEQLKFNLAPQAYYHLRRGDITTSEKLSEYKIDTRVAAELAKPATLVRVSPTTTSGPGTVVRGTGTTRPVISAQLDPFALIDQGKYNEAIEILGKVETKTSRTYYGMARAFQGLQGAASQRANYYATLALRQNGRDRQLSSAEAATCRRIQSAYKSQAG